VRLLKTRDIEKAAVPIEHTLQLQSRGYDIMHAINRWFIMISYSKSLSMLRGINASVLVHK
jgi:hypothetical protein